MIQRIWRGWKVRDATPPPLLNTVEYHYGSQMQLRGMLHFHGMPTATPDTLAYMYKYNIRKRNPGPHKGRHADKYNNKN